MQLEQYSQKWTHSLRKTTVQMSKLWMTICRKSNATTGEIVGVYIGDR
ncbi:MAG: hypothetical protein V7K40_02990 [Nostoc sp.]